VKQTVFNASAGVLGMIATYAFGGWTELLGFLLLAVVVDYATGVAAAIKEGALESSVGFWGITRKLLMFVVIMLAHRLDLLLDTNVIMIGAVYFYLANELVSITENYGRLGLPLPAQVKRIIAVLRDRGGYDDANGK
jgi:toxin secretion/phage lysis holin